MGAEGTAKVAAVDTPTFVAIPSPSKGFANKRNGHANKRGRVNLAKRKKKGGGGEGRNHIPMNVSGEALSSSSDSKILLPRTG